MAMYSRVTVDRDDRDTFVSCLPYFFYFLFMPGAIEFQELICYRQRYKSGKTGLLVVRMLEFSGLEEHDERA